MKLIKNYYQNENGNIALFVIAALGMMMVLFVFIFNMGAALYTKEKSSTAVKQASLAATSSFYEQVKGSLIGHVIVYGEDLEWSFDDEWNSRIGSCSYGPSYNECQIKVLQQIVNSALSIPILNDLLEAYLKNNVSLDNIKNAARNAITSNKGTTEGATLTIKENRFMVKASVKFNSISYDDDYLENKGDKHLEGISRNIYRDSQGPKINFLEKILGSGTTSLE